MIALQHAGTVDEVYTVGNTRSLPRVFDIEGLQQQTLSQVACGEDFSLALTDDGEVYAWGDANYGKLAAPASADMPTDDDNLPYQPLPVLVHGFGGCRLVQLACGSNHSLALTEGGRVWAWGGAIFGRLGPADISTMPLDEDGDPYQPTPVLVEGFGQERVGSIACGNIHNLAVTQSGRVYAWGGAHYGVLGIADGEGNENLATLPVDEGSSMPFQPRPTLLDAITETVVQVSCGSAHNLAVTDEGQVWAWGGAKYGRLGLSKKHTAKMLTDEDGDPYQPRPTKLDTFPNTRVLQSACGEWHSLCLADDGSIYAFGSALRGRLGLANKAVFQKHDDGEPCVPQPARIVGFEGKKVVGVSASAYFSLALTEGGDVWAWGQTAAGWLSVSCTNVVGSVPDHQPIPAHLNLAPRTHVMPAALRLTQDAPLLVIVSKEKWQTPTAELGLRGLGLPLLETFAANIEFSDLVLRVEGEVIRAHRVVLAGASEAFKQLLVAAPRVDGEVELAVSDISVGIMRTLLRHCYNGQAENTITELNALELLEAAHRFGLIGLKELCTQFLTFHLNKEIAVAVLMAADRCAAPELGAQCIQYIVHHLKAVQHCPEFGKLPKHLIGAIKLRAAQKIEQISSQLGKRTRVPA
ncbi:regulator of chromosome condensation 1/beta-lactamase-inhibitor protein II [Pavlovales sp. CCMP2436]|nr:regulator of chromosome condensation 1/beta-lactamase-inhibitor protein II [Pavlovales sp. CCMP2436]